MMESDITQGTGMESGVGLSMTTIGIVTSTGTIVKRATIEDMSVIGIETADETFGFYFPFLETFPGSAGAVRFPIA